MRTISTSPRASAGGPNIYALVEEAYSEVKESFEKFCRTTGIVYLTQMVSENAERPASARITAGPDS